MTLVDDILSVLDAQDTRWKGVTYADSSDNKFTLVDTPRLWDTGPTVNFPIQAVVDMITHIDHDVMAPAKEILDITLLWQAGTGMPNKLFQDVISHGLKAISDAKNRPLVRILVGVPFGIVVRQRDLTNWLQATIELRQQLSDVAYPILLGCVRTHPTSWNHAKIIASDGQRAVVGGHNLWSDDYVGYNPVNDVSGLIQGSVVQAAHNFCDTLWQDAFSFTFGVAKPVLLSNGQFTEQATPINAPKPQGKPGISGTTRMLSLGRLGRRVDGEFSVTTNASVSARVIALSQAKKTIRISQQSLYFSPPLPGLGGFDFYTIWGLIKALEAGVQTEIVVSNDVTLSDGGYAGDLRTVLGWISILYVADRMGLLTGPMASPTRDQMAAWAHASITPPAASSLNLTHMPTEQECAPYLNELNTRLQVAPLYHAPDVNYWNVGDAQKLAANHAKVYIIDNTHFFVGSDNFYLSGTTQGLQEYGHLVEGVPETEKFIHDYWDRLWQNSCEHVVMADYENAWATWESVRSFT